MLSLAVAAAFVASLDPALEIVNVSPCEETAVASSVALCEDLVVFSAVLLAKNLLFPITLLLDELKMAVDLPE